MTHDEIERLKEKISRAEVDEQLEIAELLINELTINNECFDNNEYDYEKSYDCIDDLTSLTEKIKNKIELRKIKSLRKRYNNLSKTKQKLLLNELVKLISSIEVSSTKKVIEKCRQEGHLFSEWEEHIYKKEHLKKDDNNKNFVTVEASYWIKRCERCGYEQKVEKEPAEITFKKKQKQLNENH